MALAALALVLAAACGGAAEPADPLAVEIGRAAGTLQSLPGGAGEKARQENEPLLARAEEALRDGRRLLALHRLAELRANLGAAAYLAERPAAQRNAAGFEAEWERLRGALRSDLGPPSSAALDGVEPAVLRALGEAALLQVRGYHEASLDYGRNTTPEAGLYYLGAAQAQHEVLDLSRGLSSRDAARRPPPVRALDRELDALESGLLAAYRPPASIDRHREFIVASATLKEARELDAAGLYHGALMRYLQAVQQAAPLLPGGPATEAARAGERLQELDARLAGGEVDHSLGRLFLEMAQAHLAAGNPDAAAVLAGEVLPRYFSALEPAPPAEPGPAPRVTVTLVRWPYT